ncbi:uncharacterized protein LOC143289993 [Babylonia areolata]|uniref:uncharacterized protein LOC143289993 n=1 Tax=Babylonia areolata TaxID=304850 RepID=UPI003FD328B1
MTESETERGASPDDVDHGEEVFTSQTEFLRAIHHRFLELVLPIESGLVDRLRADAVFDSEDEESIRNAGTRRNRARRCWSLLDKVPPGRFHSHCFPALEATCSLVVDGKRFQWDGGVHECLRHLIQKVVPLRRFADMFPGAGACSQQEYRRITEGSDMDESLWKLVFKLVAWNKDNAALRDNIETTLLKSVGIPVPADLQGLLAKGFPCTCPTKGKKRSKKRRHKKQRTYHETLDSETMEHTTTERLPSVERSPSVARLEQNKTLKLFTATDVLNHYIQTDSLKEEFAATEEEEEDQECCFKSQEQKDTFLRRLEDHNKAIASSLRVKAVLQEVKGIQMELAALRQKTRSGTSGQPTADVSDKDKGKTQRLHKALRGIMDTLDKEQKEASRVLQESGEAGAPDGPDTSLPARHHKALLDRRAVLVTAFAEAEGFHGQCRDIVDRLDIFGHLAAPQGVTEETGPHVTPSVMLPELIAELDQGTDYWSCDEEDGNDFDNYLAGLSDDGPDYDDTYFDIYDNNTFDDEIAKVLDDEMTLMTALILMTLTVISLMVIRSVNMKDRRQVRWEGTF